MSSELFLHFVSFVVSRHFIFDRGFKRVAGQKVPTNTIAYYNKNFLRGERKLLLNMNGGKSKFISAREKRVRAQVRRERDQEQSVILAAHQRQAFFPDQLGMGGALGLQTAGALRPGSLDNLRLQQLLASRSMASHPLQQQQQQQSDGMRVAEHMFAAEQARAMLQQRDELQLRLLCQGLPSLLDPREEAVSNQWLERNAMRQSTPFATGARAGLNLSQLRTIPSDAPLSAAAFGADMTTEQMLMARQLADAAGGSAHINVQAVMAQRYFAQRMGGAVGGNVDHSDVALAKRVQQRMEEEQMMKIASSATLSPPKQSEGGGGQTPDQQLWQLYMMEQKRKQDMVNNFNARQA